MTNRRPPVEVSQRKQARIRILAGALRRARDWKFLNVMPLPIYSLAFLAYYVFSGNFLEFLLGMYFALAFPVLLFFGKARDAARYWVPFIVILLSYEALQGVAGSLAASKNLFSLYPADTMIWGLNLTGWIQSTFSSEILTEICLLLYFLHFPLIVVTSTVLWIFKRSLFNTYRIAIMLTSYAALVTFLFIPTIPPWYQGAANDLVEDASISFLPHSAILLVSLIESDKFAAFPSIHAAYAVMFSYFMLRLDRRLALIALPVTVGILFSTIYLGQHYLIDLIGGSVYALIPCLLSDRAKLRRLFSSRPFPATARG